MKLTVLIMMLWLLLSLIQSTSLASLDEMVTVIQSENFADTLTEGEIWFVNFYASSCGRSIGFYNVWNEVVLSKTLHSFNIKFGQVDCKYNYPICDKYDVRYYNQLKLFKKGTLVHYYGERSADAIIKFILQNV